MTENELNSQNELCERLGRIAELKENLKDTDYKAIKYAEGLITPQEYEITKTLRKIWRDEINRLESEVASDE